MIDDNIAGITNEGLAVAAIISKENRYIKIRKDKNFEKWISNPLKTSNGQTVGEMNRKQLHDWLDAFIDKENFEGC